MKPYEYLDRAVQLERLAADESDPVFRTQLINQAKAYRKLAAQQSEKQRDRLDRTS
jgi:hypothetical protein